MQQRKPKRPVMTLTDEQLGRAREGVIIEALIVLYRLTYPHKAKMDTISKELFGVSRVTVNDAIAGKTHLGVESLLRAQAVVNSDLVTRFIQAKQ